MSCQDGETLNVGAAITIKQLLPSLPIVIWHYLVNDNHLPTGDALFIRAVVTFRFFKVVMRVANLWLSRPQQLFTCRSDALVYPLLTTGSRRIYDWEEKSLEFSLLLNAVALALSGSWQT